MPADTHAGGIRRDRPSEQSPPSNTTKRKDHQHYECHRHIAKKEKLVLLNGVTVAGTETLTSTSVGSQATSSSHHHHGARSIPRKPRKKPRGGRKNKKDSRQWSYSTCDFSNCKDRIVFLSYNILGVENALKHQDLYHEVPPEYLDWDYRKRVLYKEIKNYGPGIICLQEVDRFQDLDNLLQRVGFRGVYKGRTGEALDGCAIFWDAELYTLLHEDSIEFQSFGLRNNVSQICVFKMKENQLNKDMNSQGSEFTPSRSFLIGNIHALFNPGRGDIKVGQMRLFLEKTHTLSQQWGNIPVVIAGDFNIMPQSAIYQFLSSSELEIQQHDRKQMSGQTCPKNYSGFQNKFYRDANIHASRKPLLYRWSETELSLATGSASGHLRHPLKLCSTYVGVPGSRQTRNSFGEPLATSFHSKFMGTVDYIWHTRELLPVRVLETLPLDKLRETGGLPNKQWGSDHLALVCELAFSDGRL